MGINYVLIPSFKGDEVGKVRDRVWGRGIGESKVNRTATCLREIKIATME